MALASRKHLKEHLEDSKLYCDVSPRKQHTKTSIEHL